VGVTTGSYGELVTAANKFFDQGQTQMQSQNWNQGVAYFEAAAMTYAAAWHKQSTDPNVGTDFASSLFYSGRLDDALKQADAVIAKHPDFQSAYLTKGNALAHKGLTTDQKGDKTAAKAFYAEAKLAYTKAISLDPNSEAGKLAKTMMKQTIQ
jgi:tetratricopeptide (TPR) repeat protein